MNYNFPPGQGRYFVLSELTKQKSGPGKRPLVVFINPLFNQSLIEFFFHFNQHIDRHILKVVFRLPAHSSRAQESSILLGQLSAIACFTGSI